MAYKFGRQKEGDDWYKVVVRADHKPWLLQAQIQCSSTEQSWDIVVIKHSSIKELSYHIGKQLRPLIPYLRQPFTTLYTVREPITFRASYCFKQTYLSKVRGI